MAKKAEKEAADIAGLPEELFKQWKDKMIHGADFKDSDLMTFSTNSAKLDWALGLPFIEGSIVEIYGENSTGKAQPLDSLVLTPNGFKRMGDISIGEIVSTPDGKTAEVDGIYPQGQIDIYNVYFSDGSIVECCADHLWFTRTLTERTHKRIGMVRSTKDISATLRRKDGSFNHVVPYSSPVEFNQKGNLNLDPYLLGALLGDGSLSEKSGLGFSNMDSEIIDRVNANLNNIGCELVRRTACDFGISGKIRRDGSTNKLKDILDKMNLLGKDCYTKFIPEEYKYTSIENRIELIRGLFDTDGYIEKGGGVVFTTTSKQLSEDVKFIIQSLGGRAKIKELFKTYSYEGVKKTGALTYNIYLRTPRDIVPFSVTRKTDRFSESRFGPTRTITGVELIGKKEAQCIHINSEEHMYITNNFVPTHNTSIALEVAANVIKAGRKVFYIDLERKLREAQIAMIRDLDRSGLIILYPHTGEEAADMMEACFRNFPGSCAILDAVAGLLPEVEDAEGAEKLTMGTVAKLCHKMMRKLTGIISQNKCLLIALNHKTASMSMYGPSDTVHGGKAITNRAAQRIELVRHMSKLIKSGAAKEGEEGGEIIGQITKCKVVKNNVGKPFREVEVPIIYGQGIARELDLMEFAEDLGVLVKAGGWYDLDGQKLRKTDIIAKLFSDKEFFKSIKDKVAAVLA